MVSPCERVMGRRSARPAKRQNGWAISRLRLSIESFAGTESYGSSPANLVTPRNLPPVPLTLDRADR
jgi:hypothetical protein